MGIDRAAWLHHGPLHHLDPRVKLLWLATAVAALAVGDPVFTGTLCLLDVILAIVGRVALRQLHLLVALLPMIVVVVAFNALTIDVVSGVFAALRFATLAAWFSLYFLSTTPEDLAAALEYVRVPQRAVFVMVGGMRFAPVVVRELDEVRAALRARGIELERGVVGRVRSWTYVLVPLIAGTLRRSVRLGEAIEARAFGYTGRRTAMKQLALGRTDGVALVCLLLLIAVAILWERSS